MPMIKSPILIVPAIEVGLGLGFNVKVLGLGPQGF